jgi:hypothetical protein
MMQIREVLLTTILVIGIGSTTLAVAKQTVNPAINAAKSETNAAGLRQPTHASNMSRIGAKLAENEGMGACECTVRLTGQHVCTETTESWCNAYNSALSCSWVAGGTCDNN